MSKSGKEEIEMDPLGASKEPKSKNGKDADWVVRITSVLVIVSIGILVGILIREYLKKQKYDSQMIFGIMLTIFGIIGLTWLWFQLWRKYIDRWTFYGSIFYILVTVAFGLYILIKGSEKEGFLTVPVPAEYELAPLDNKVCNFTMSQIFQLYPTTTDILVESDNRFDRYTVNGQGFVSRNGIPVIEDDVDFSCAKSIMLMLRTGQTLVLCRP